MRGPCHKVSLWELQGFFLRWHFSFINSTAISELMLPVHLPAEFQWIIMGIGKVLVLWQLALALSCLPASWLEFPPSAEHWNSHRCCFLGFVLFQCPWELTAAQPAVAPPCWGRQPAPAWSSWSLPSQAQAARPLGRHREPWGCCLPFLTLNSGWKLDHVFPC